jgi:hypothetical protein
MVTIENNKFLLLAKCLKSTVFLHRDQNLQKVLRRPSNSFFIQISIRYKKTQNFILIPSSLYWAQKIFRKKVKDKKLRDLCVFLDFALFPLFFANTFWGHFLSQFERSWELGTSIKFCVV